MTLYAIGDIQGCAQSFTELLSAITFDRDEDHLWLVGDLVNRGPDSLAVLREVMYLGDSVTTVLGNHDLHLLAAAAGVSKPGSDDTLHQVLAAPDAANILDWLRYRPLLHHDEARNLLLVHAGLPPTWSVAEAVARADTIAAELQTPGWAKTLKNMYGDEPRSWSPDLNNADRSRYVINALTRMRYCDSGGALDFEHAGPPGTQPKNLVPWFDYRERAETNIHVVFGHWASLGLLRRADITALDSGCVWGRTLTAVPLEPAGEPVAIACTEIPRDD